ncbi:ATP-binding protein [Lachnospiraceae bacterium]|nr:GHKL domain-containing protein [uncultured Schaedlerella sp.]MCI9154511.1 GHKL domain-containing protein [Ruminococcus sp.]NBI57008.1 ATP-binding protein [Lachnospiraceae bacterium]
MGVKAFLVGMSFFEVGMLYWLLCGTVLDRKYFQKKEWVIICANIFLIGINMGGNRSLIFFSQSAFIVCIVVACICVILINGQYKFLRIIIIILYYTFVALVDFFVAFLSMIVLRHEFKNMVYLYANSIMECILFFCVRLIIACCVYQIVKQKFDKAYIREFQRMLLMIMIIMCLMLKYYHIAIARMMYEGREQEAGTMGLSLVGVMLITLFTGIVYLKNKTIEKEKELLIMRETMVTQKYTELETVMEKNRQLSHDLKNHILVLKHFKMEENYEGIDKYIEEIEQNFFEIKKRVWTGNQIADMLLEQKRTLAEQEGITFTIQAVPITEWMFDDSETCSLLGNLLDNAIEACNRMEENADKWISIKIENQKQILFIKIENAVSEAPVMKNGRPVSMKHDKMRHGYGLKSVERILNKYDGTIVYLSRNKAFQIKLLF